MCSTSSRKIVTLAYLLSMGFGAAPFVDASRAFLDMSPVSHSGMCLITLRFSSYYLDSIFYLL